MTLLRDGDSINFQKASCTLDGCVKIYTSRVDSVDTETRKLLHGLSSERSTGDKQEKVIKKVLLLVKVTLDSQVVCANWPHSGRESSSSQHQKVRFGVQCGSIVQEDLCRLWWRWCSWTLAESFALGTQWNDHVWCQQWSCKGRQANLSDWSRQTQAYSFYYKVRWPW